MTRLFSISLLFLFAGFSVAKAGADEESPTAKVVENQESAAPDFGAPATRSIVRDYCFGCHGADGSDSGDLRLNDVTLHGLSSDADLVENLLHVIETREMPPEGEPQPTADQRGRMTTELRALLRSAVAHSSDRPRTPIRRLNRFQYNNAIVDLFDLDCIVFTLPERALRVHKDYFDPASGRMPATVTVGNRPLGKSQLIEPRLSGVAAFPQDLRAEHGYDNRADHLSLSPLLMEQFLKLGQSITQSPDFNSEHVGIWHGFFAAPAADADVPREVRRRLRPFLTKAFRGRFDENLFDRYARFVLQNIASGATFTDAMKETAAAVIASPRFLYLYEAPLGNVGGGDVGAGDADAGPADQVSGRELASRLSFFLWGSLPDAQLLSLADQGELHQPEVLMEQVDRMLRDKKLKRFCDSFPSQWLQLDRIVSSIPDRETFPDFYFSKYRMSMHMMLEPLLLFETVLIEDLPITQLIDSDFTYRSAKLEAVYGPLGRQDQERTGGGVGVLKFQRVPVTDRRSGGVMTNAAVMTMTSGPERTQPITRGAWVAAVIFNDPPEPPPADVPPLSEKPSADERLLTLRERLAAHRERADCRGCHERIDPLGFVFENYNPVGAWRDKYENGRAIDASGSLFQEHAFSDVAEFKAAILEGKDRFCSALAGHLLSFALARELGPADQLALEKITDAVATDDYKMKTLIRQLILSEPFRTKS